MHSHIPMPMQLEVVHSLIHTHTHEVAHSLIHTHTHEVGHSLMHGKWLSCVASSWVWVVHDMRDMCVEGVERTGTIVGIGTNVDSGHLSSARRVVDL